MQDKRTSIAVLCPGMSLRAFLDRPGEHDHYIAVNKAVEAFPAEWWVFNDWQAFGDFSPVGVPMICTSEAVRKRLRDRPTTNQPSVANHQWLTFEQINTTCPQSPGWWFFSMTAALVLAEFLVAERVVIYGCDWNGGKYWDGSEPKRGGITPYRWQNEQHKYKAVVGWLVSRGVEVRRVEAGP